jgi:hypothetical protein
MKYYDIPGIVRLVQPLLDEFYGKRCINTLLRMDRFLSEQVPPIPQLFPLKT